MYNEIVVDASVCVSWLHPQDVNHDVSRLWIEQYFLKDGILIVPALLLIEVAAAISRRKGDALLVKKAIRRLETASAIQTIQIVPLDAALIQAAVEAATNLQLRAGDAIYVALARQMKIPLISWDKEQLQRANSVLTAAYTPDSYPFEEEEREDDNT